MLIKTARDRNQGLGAVITGWCWLMEVRKRMMKKLLNNIFLCDWCTFDRPVWCTFKPAKVVHFLTGVYK
jgi:hypothetical protein